MKFLVILTILLFAVIVSAAESEKTATQTTTETPTTGLPTTVRPDPNPVDDKEFPPAAEYKMNTTDNTTTCLYAKFGLQFVIETKNEPNPKYINIRDAHIESNCPADLGNMTTELTLSLKFHNTSRLDLKFNRTDPTLDKESYYLSHISLKYPEPTSVVDIELPQDHHLFVVNGAHKSFKCNSETSYKFEDSLNGTNRTVKIIFREVFIDAFRINKDTKNSVQICPLDEDVSDMIPIAVGAALLALVAIVLVAYFIGRRRSRRLAYQSV